MKKVAVIGAGISGLAAASLLSRRHRVDLFEQDRRLGGHTNTVLVDGPNGTVPLDTGLLAHNNRTYPNLVRLFGELGVATRDSDMSFAVSCRRSGLEYSSRGANGFFAQRRNLMRPSHLSLLREIVRFNRDAPALLGLPDAERQTLGDFLESRRFGDGFTHRYLREAGARIEVLRADYRELSGRFDKVVSIEMFEAVGLSHYDEYFKAVDRLLAPDGVMFLQTITVDDQWFPRYHGTPDWVEKYIFPGGELASVGEMLKSLARTTSLSLYHAENCGTHYAHTLRACRARFRRNLARVRALGFDDRFIRMWDLYLASCEATFLERHTGLFQIVLLKNGAQRVQFNEPWSEAASGPRATATESAA